MEARKITNAENLERTTSLGIDVNVRSVRKTDDGKVHFKGWANRFNLPDSYNTRIDVHSMDIQRYRANPLLLVNHDVEKVCGMATAIEKKDEGLWVEGFISSSSAPHVAYVRDMVLEGCLRGLSIRFGGDKIAMEKDPEHENCQLIRYSELMEISIVSIPAQPESLLSIRSVKMQNIRGMKAAGCIKEALAKAIENGVTEEDIMERLRDKSGLEAGSLQKALSGEVTPMPETLVAAAIDVLGCDENELKSYDAQDVEASKEESGKPADVEPEPIRAEGDVQDCISKKIPKLIEEGKSQEQAIAIAISMCSEERGCKFEPTDEQILGFVTLARQATQEPGPTEPVEHKPANDNEMLAKLDGLAELLKTLIMEVKGLKQAVAIDAMDESDEDKSEQEMKSQEDKDEPIDEETERMIAERFAQLETKARKLGLI